MPKHCARLFAAAIALLACASARAQMPAGMRPIRRDECGLVGRQPHVMRGQSWTYEANRASGSVAERTVAFDAESVRIRYPGMKPDARYAVRVTYLTEVDQARSQRLTANGSALHEAMDLPRGRPGTFDYSLPNEDLRGDGISLEFQHVSGPNAVVGAVELWSNVEQPALSVSAAVDEHTRRLTVTATDGMLRLAPGCHIACRLAGLSSADHAPAKQEGFTDASGQWAAQIGPSWFKLLEFRIQVSATRGGVGATAPLTFTPFAPPDYVPRPSNVAGVAYPRMSLDGYWRFCPMPGGLFWLPEAARRDWKPILVPGEWALQGFTVAADAEAGYARSFTLPADWDGARIRLRFGAVFCDARVWVNGKLVATHRGGFTPFEADITNAVRQGPNLLVVGVCDQGTTDVLEKGSQYAFHRIGGILRSVSLVALPAANLTRLHVRTSFPHGYASSVLEVAGAASSATAPGTRVSFVLKAANGARVATGSAIIAATRSFHWSAPIRAPALWTAETPDLYTLTASTPDETVSKRIGFREVRVAGGRLLVNGKPVKLRGVNRHEVHPKMGRAMAGLWHLDAEQFKAANVNYVRTSHYPAALEFLDACDELGIYVLEEASLIWVSPEQSVDPNLRGAFVSAGAEMVERDQDHPSIILWSLANESAWGPNFDAEREHVAKADPTRPILFGGENSMANGPAKQLPILSIHYPGPDVKHTGTVPYLFTEYCHINCYNKDELALDPGVRDEYGRYLKAFWDDFDAQEGIIGGSIWAGIDEVFDLPSGRTGYGEWGIIDGDRRQKPEWWHVKKAYSPVHVPRTDLPPPIGGTVHVPVWNRFDFLNLSALRIEWRSGKRSGVAHADVPPRSHGAFAIAGGLEPGEPIDLRFLLGEREVDQERLQVAGKPRGPHRAPARAPAARLARTPDALVVNGPGGELRVSTETGLLAGWSSHGRPTQIAGPWLHVLSRGECREWPGTSAWKLTKLEAAETEAGLVSISAVGTYGNTRGTIHYWVGGDGQVQIDLTFALGPDAPSDPKEYGLKLMLPAVFDRLKWEREGLWTTYPEGHIGRLAGEASAKPDPASASWERLGNEYGSNDFRSMKYRVKSASLASRSGATLTAWPQSDPASVRACLQDGGVAWYLNAYANGGAEQFLAGSVARELVRLKPGDHLRVSATLEMR